ncbi:MAG: riboflavin biosynthesis protein RibF [Planctomycetota bacterium]|nr:riboflavin biosynthesis protein RibF [Planctomycetota bacterium]
MRVLHGLEGLSQLPGQCVLTIGNLDGVHLGHRALLRTARDIADGGGISGMAVVTFEPHPLTVLRPQQAPPRLTPPAIKQPLIESAGADNLVILPPEPGVLGLTAERFWTILRDEVKAAHLVEGSAFRFGKGAAGNVQKLREWARDSPVKLTVVTSVQVPLMDLQLAPVSSSLIRFLLGVGRVRDAAICLGRPYALRGRVTKGAARGRQLGFPTANLDCGDQMIPAEAVYAGRCEIAGILYPAAISIGSNPTFGDDGLQVEAYLVGFAGDLYGQTISLELLDWLREQRKFAGVKLLVAQIERDVELAKALVMSDPSRPVASEDYAGAV